MLAAAIPLSLTGSSFQVGSWGTLAIPCWTGCCVKTVSFAFTCCKFVFNCGGGCCGTFAVVAVLWFQLDGSVEPPACYMH